MTATFEPLGLNPTLAEPATAALATDSLLDARFRVGALVGQGGMSRVYHAFDERSGEAVAVKLLHEGDHGGTLAARFAREAELLAQLSHPAIVRHVAHGATPDGPAYLAMEWLAGEDLAQRLQRGPLGVDEVVRLLRRAAEGLAAAHARGILHRDLKPSNLFLVGGRVDELKLLDFGIARRIAAPDTLTRAGAVLGTPQYMAPEQVRADRPLTAACDVHALGCIAFECLCGRPPFVADSLAALFVQILFDPPPPLQGLRPDAPPWLVRLLARMLARSPEGRPADAAAVLAALDAPSDPLFAAPTLAQDSADGRPQTRDPQLCCVVHAIPGAPGSAVDAIDRAAVSDALTELGARSEWLIDGALIAVITSRDSAIDQARIAAHAALLIRGRWPGARIALATGTAESVARRPIGEAVERSARMLAAADSDTSGVWLDPLSARLLERRFALLRRGSDVLLASEHAFDDAARPLLRRPTPCVGRDSELAFLDLVLRGCDDEPEARAAVVTGPPGCGKSRLRHEFLRRLGARGGACTVIAGAADLMTAGSPYAALARGLRRLCGLADGERPARTHAAFVARVTAQIPAEQAARVLEFLGELCELPTPAPSPALQAAREDPAIMHTQIQRAFLDWLTAECAAGPVLLVLDDLQWGDRLTVALVDEALRRLAERPLRVLALGRPELADAFPALWTAHHPHLLGLRPLARRACERLVRHVLGAEASPALVARLAAHSAGNVLYLEELIRAQVDAHDDDLGAPPATVLAMLQARLGRLSPELRRVLRVASVFASPFAPATLRALVGHELSTERLEAALAQLAGDELLERTPGPGDGDPLLVFRHELMRHAVHAQLEDDERRALHRGAAAHLAAAPDPSPRALAEHLLLADEPRLAGPWLLRSARQALANNDLTGAHELADRAAAVAEDADGELAALQAMLAYWQSDYPACTRHGEAALARLPRGGAAYFRVLGDVVVAAARQRRPGSADAWFVAATPDDPPARRELAICRARATLQASLSDLPDADAQLAALDALLAGAAIDDPLARAHIAHARGVRAASRGELADYVEQLAAVTAAFEEAGDLRNLAVERSTLAGCCFQLGQVARAESLARENLGLCQQLRAPQALGFAQMTLGLILAGRPETRDEARELLAAAEAYYVAVDHPRRRGILHTYKAVLALESGDPAAAVAEAVLADRYLAGFPGFRAWALAIGARARLHRHGPADALPLARAAVALLAELGALLLGETLPRLVLAECLHALGDHAGAVAEAAAGRALVERRAAGIRDPHARRLWLELPHHVRLRTLHEATAP